MKRSLPLLAAVWSGMMAGQGYGQTAVDLRTQSKSVDFSGALSTRPVRTGPSLPATCQIGELFFRTDIETGKNLYGCVAANSWRQMAADVSFSGVTGIAAVVQGGTGAGDAATARANLGAAATIHTHSVTDLNGVTGKAGSGNLLQMFGGGTVNPNDCARFDGSGNVISAGAPCGSGGSGGTGSIPPTLTPITFSATPTFPITNSTQGFTLTLSGDVTSSTFSGVPSDGQEVWFRICQDGNGGHAFAYPVSIVGEDTIDTAPSACTSQLFKYLAASTSYAGVTAGKSDNATAGLVTPAGALALPAGPDTLVGRLSADTLSNKTFIAPALGAASATSINGTPIPSNTTLLQVIASGSLALATNSIASGACQAVSSGVNNATATGADPTRDTVSFTPSASIKAITGYVPGTSGGLSVNAYVTANAVNFDVCNWTSSAVVPGAVVVRWKVIR